MSRIVTTPTSDSDAATRAGALLAAATTLDVPVERVRTVSHGARVAYSAPTEVYTEAALTGGVPAVDDFDDPPPDNVTATVTFHYTGTGWTIDADLTAGIPGRAVQLAAAGQEFPLTTGQAYTAVGTIGAGVGTPFSAPLRLTDLDTTLFDQETVPFNPELTGPYTLTVTVL